MRSVDWTGIRPWNGSQFSAFEELCCQLAAAEAIPGRERFFRKGAPDAGVECYWTLRGGSEWAWQAKYFRSPPTTGQWSEIDESVRTALDKHPGLVRYVVCLPQDRADPRRDDSQHFMDRWDERVLKWDGWAQARGMEVTFDYWGAHELLDRLSREEHSGRYYFWFERVALGANWFRDRMEETLASVGARYTAGFNVELPVSRLFDGLLRDGSFFGRLEAMVREVKSRREGAYLGSLAGIAASESEAVQGALDAAIAAADRVVPDLVTPVDIEGLSRALEAACSAIGSLIAAVHDADRRASEEERAAPSDTRPRPTRRRYETYSLERLLAAVSQVRSWCDGDEARLANAPRMLVVGEAGAGKTHLLCDVAREVVSRGGPAVVFLGSELAAGDPWSGVLRILGLECTREEFLGALDAAAEASGRRALLVIDALNESDQKERWAKQLGGVTLAVSRFPRIAFVVSVRGSYEDQVVPRGLVPDAMKKVTHRGFEGSEYEAANAFFDHHGLERPGTPLLLPEFRNPLFLSLFCKGIAARADRRVPRGMEGITAIFDRFVDDVNERLSSPDALDFDARSRPVQLAIAGLAREMAEACTRSLGRDRARQLVDSELPREGFERSLFRRMLAEGLLVENRAYSEGGDREVVQFGYERFGDHAVARYLLDTHLDRDDPAGSFAQGTPLGRHLETESAAWRERGLIEAFSIQVPERVGRELGEVAPHAARFEPVVASFAESLLWRRPSSLGAAALALVRGELDSDQHSKYRMLDVLVRLATGPDHPLNADYLHDLLLGTSMPVRDSWWSPYLHDRWGEQSGIETLIDWAWSAVGRDRLDDDSRLRAGVVLGWCLTCPNRFVRDRATKGLVGIFDRHLDAIPRLFEAFRAVDDPYVAERLYAVAYGCALRSPAGDGLVALADSVFRLVFADGSPPPNIMLRDYARGVIELATASGWSHPDSHLASPPYRSEWEPRAPSEAELRAWATSSGDRVLDGAASSIVSSVMGLGDFGAYVIGTNAGGLPWLTVPLSEPITHAMKYRFEAFEQSLTESQRELWENRRALVQELDLYGRLAESALRFEREEPDLEGAKFPDQDECGVETIDDDGRENSDSPEPDGVDLGGRGDDILESLGLSPLLEEGRIERFTSGELARAVERGEGDFLASLSPEQAAEYEVVGRYAGRRYELDVMDRFDLDLVQRWVASRAFGLGWDHGLHGWFDSQLHLHHAGLDAHKSERIGKKYQWIAYYECLARIADNFHFSGADGEGRRYEGPWQLRYLRNIDPSWLPAVSSRGGTKPAPPSWLVLPRVDWGAVEDDREWLRSATDLPAAPSLIEARDERGDSWLTLSAGFNLRQEGFQRDRGREHPYRKIGCSITGHLVRAMDLDTLLAWADGRDMAGGWLNGFPDTHAVFYGEIHRAGASTPREASPEGFGAWTRDALRDCPVDLCPAGVRYTWGGGDYDCSVEDAVLVRVPCRLLYESMGLAWYGQEGRYAGPGGRVVARDTRVDRSEPDSLVARRDAIEAALESNGLSLVWLYTADKLVMTDHHQDDESYAGRLLVSGLFACRGGVIGGSAAPIYHNRRETEPLGVLRWGPVAE